MWVYLVGLMIKMLQHFPVTTCLFLIFFAWIVSSGYGGLVLYYATSVCIIYAVLFWEFRNSFEVSSRHVRDFTAVDCTDLQSKPFRNRCDQLICPRCIRCSDMPTSSSFPSSSAILVHSTGCCWVSSDDGVTHSCSGEITQSFDHEAKSLKVYSPHSPTPALPLSARRVEEEEEEEEEEGGRKQRTVTFLLQ